MSVVFSGSFSGNFVSTGLETFIPLPSGADFMRVENETVSYTGGGGGGAGAEFFWRRGMEDGRGTIYTRAAGVLSVGKIAAGAGFYFINTTVNTPGASTAWTAISNATPPVVDTANTAGLIANSTIVRMFTPAGSGALQLGGIDFTVGTVIANTSFTLAYMDGIVAAAGPGTFRIIPFNPYFYPSTRYITKIISDPADSTQAIVTLSVTHSYTVGQKIRLKIPRVTALAFGMTELNDVEATIVAIGAADADGTTNTITIDVDVTGFTPFAWPLTTDPAFTPAQVIPIGENTAKALNLGANILGDATQNIAQFGMLLKAGANSPAGLAGDIIAWQAFKSFNQ